MPGRRQASIVRALAKINLARLGDQNNDLRRCLVQHLDCDWHGDEARTVNLFVDVKSRKRGSIVLEVGRRWAEPIALRQKAIRVRSSVDNRIDLDQCSCRLPLATEAYGPTNAFDAMERRLRNPLGSFRISGGEGRLRRYALKALAVLATNTDRQEQVWRAAQELIVTAERQDSVAVAEVGFRLSERGFAPNLPWASMAYSADREMRQLAAAMLPFLSEIDYEAAESLSRDAVTNVRCELAISLSKLAERAAGTEESQRERVAPLIGGMRDDSSHRVRSALPQP
jgi:hypothetical protein